MHAKVNAENTNFPEQFETNHGQKAQDLTFFLKKINNQKLNNGVILKMYVCLTEHNKRV